MKRAAVAAVLACATTAHAETSDRTEIIITDGVSDALIVAPAWRPIEEGAGTGPFWLGLSGAILGGPIVHAAHHDWGRAGIDLGARVIAIPVGAMIGDALCEHDPSSHGDILPCIGHDLIGAALGLIAAEVVDWTVIARGPTSTPMMLTFGGHF